MKYILLAILLFISCLNDNQASSVSGEIIHKGTLLGWNNVGRAFTATFTNSVIISKNNVNRLYTPSEISYGRCYYIIKITSTNNKLKTENYILKECK